MTTDPTPIRPDPGISELEARYGPPTSYMQWAPPASSKSQGMAVAALVLGIIGLLFSWFTFGIPSILAVIFGHIALSNANAGKWGGKGMAVAGLVTGWVAVGLFLLLIALIAVA